MKSILISLICLGLFSCRTTTLHLKATSSSWRGKMTNGEWDVFSDKKPVSFDVVMKKAPLKLLKPKVIFYDTTKIVLKLLEVNKQDTTDGGFEYIMYNAIDNDKCKCYLILINRNESVDAIIYHSNVNVCYNLVESLDD